MMWLYTAILYAIIVIFIYFIFDHIKKRIKVIYYLNKLPSDAKTKLLGNLIQVFCNDVKFFQQLRRWSREHGPSYLISITFLFPSLNVAGAEAFEKIASTTKNIQKSLVYHFLHVWLGQGLLTSTGTKWHTRRKILTSAFHFSILPGFITIFNNETHVLVDVLKNECTKPWTNVIPLISQFTLCSISETSMGTALDFESTEDKNYVAAIHELGNIFFRRFVRPWQYVHFIYYNFFSSGRKEKQLVKTLHNFTDKIIAKRSSTFEKFKVPDDDDDDSYNYSKRRKLAFLDLMINAKITDNSIDDKGIKDEVNTFMFEGHDTSATSICFTLMLLANHKNYQDQIYQEIITILGSNEEPGLNDLNELKIMDRVIKESLRLYPSVPFIARNTEEDIIVDGYFIPKDSTAHIHVFDIHREEKYWPNPEKFDPDRFLPENCINRHPFAYVPFSAGPRNCIGQKFAMLELKAVLSGILRNFIVEPIDSPETIRLVPDIILRTDNRSVKVKFILRNP